MQKIAVILYGAPGSGKGTQSELVANTYGLTFFDTGSLIRKTIYDPANANDETIQRQKGLYEKGLLCERPWVYGLVSRALQTISMTNGVVLGGSPRSPEEAFDQTNSDGSVRPGVYSLLSRAYGKEHIYIFHLKVRVEVVTKRNGTRKVCNVCQRGYLPQPTCELTTCPICASPLMVRTDDNPAVMTDRIKEFNERVVPVIDGAKHLGYEVHEINGELAPYEVFAEIRKRLPTS